MLARTDNHRGGVERGVPEIETHVNSISYYLQGCALALCQRRLTSSTNSSSGRNDGR